MKMRNVWWGLATGAAACAYVVLWMGGSVMLLKYVGPGAGMLALFVGFTFPIAFCWGFLLGDES